ncbi:uncharacterized protein LOC142340425 isoform X2 [Convolutriloba macropyga]
MSDNSNSLVPIDPKDVTILPPPVYRYPGRGRWTNQLKYLLMTVIRPILNLKCARYFKAPVDPIALRVPSYYDIITNPMDLGSIKKRLDNNYYVNAQECIDDVNLVLRNCYTFNKPEHCVYMEGRQLEEQFKKRIGKMPFDEIEIPFTSKTPNISSPKKKVPGGSIPHPVVHSTSIDVEPPPSAITPPPAIKPEAPLESVEPPQPVQPESCVLESEPSPELKSEPLVESTQPDLLPTSSCSDKAPSPPPLEDVRTPLVENEREEETDVTSLPPPPLTPAPVTEELNISPTADLSSQTVTQSGLPILECAINRPQLSPDDAVSSAVDDNAVVHSTQEDDNLDFGGDTSTNVTNPLNISIEDTKEDDCSASDASAPFDGQDNGDTNVHMVTSSVRPFAVQPSKTKKGVKRKADTTTPHTPSYNKSSGATSLYADDSNSARTSTRKIKPPNKELPGEDEPFGKAFKKSPLSNQMRFCEKLIKELLGKTHAEYAWPFYQPAYEKWNLPDYLDKIKHPMDLGTVKKKLEAREYKSAREFADDVRLIFSNCYLYNPSDNPIYIMAQKLHNLFENKMARLPAKMSSPSSGELSTSNSNSDRSSITQTTNNHHTRNSTATATAPVSNFSKSYQSNIVASKVAAAKQASPNKYKKANGEVRGAHDSKKSAKYSVKSHSNSSSSSKSAEHSPQSKNVSPQPAPPPLPVNPPQPEMPDANTIAALQKQLQAVMQQLTQMQQGGFQHDAKSRDASNIQSQIDSLTTPKKQRAPKRPRKTKGAATIASEAVDSAKTGSVHASAAAASSSNSNQTVITTTTSVSTAEAFATTVSMVASNNNKKNDIGATESSFASPHLTSYSTTTDRVKSEPNSLQQQRYPLSTQTSQPNSLPSTDVINSSSGSAATVAVVSANDHSKSAAVIPSSRTTSPPLSRPPTEVCATDLGPGQLPLTNGLPASHNTGSSQLAVSNTATTTVNSYWSTSVSKTNNAKSDTQSLIASSSVATTTTTVKGGPGRKKVAANSDPSSYSPPAKKSNLKKVTKMPRPSDFVLDSDEEDNATDMTYEEKRQLSSNIDRLTKPQLYRVVHILRAHEPQLQDADVAEITLDLETVRAVTLRALEKFVNQCLKSKKPRGTGPAAKKQTQAPPPPPPTGQETLPLEEYHSRKEELVRKIEELGGKKVAKTYEKELSEGINLDPVNHGVSRLSDASSSDDSGDSSSDSDGSSDSDSNSDDDSPQKGALKNAANSQSSAGGGSAKRRQSPKGGGGGGSMMVNGGKRVHHPPTSVMPTTSAFSNFAQVIKTTEATSASFSAGSSSMTTATVTGTSLKGKNGFPAMDGTSMSVGGGGGAGSGNKVLSTWASALSTTSVTSSSASSVNSMFQQFQKQARERSQFEQQLKNKVQSDSTAATNNLKCSNAPNLSESEDEMDDVTIGGGVKRFGPTHGHVVDLNEQMNLINSFESSTTS